MTDGAKLIVSWLNQNVLTAYQEPVSSKAVLPYISFSYSESEMGVDTMLSLSIWTRSTSYASAYEYADKIDELLGKGEEGILIRGDDIYMKIRRGSPFSQNKSDEDDTIRAVLVNLVVTKY